MTSRDRLVPQKTTPFITKFELARVIGIRMLQLHERNEGVELGDTLERVAIRELRDGNTPLVIRRHLPDGSFEDCAVRNLLVDETSARFVMSPERDPTTARILV